LANLPGAFDGFTIAQLSDLHRGRVVGAGHLRKAARLTNDLRPDLVCLTGDYISGPAKHAASCAEVLGDLRAAHGVYAILGNHDHWANADGVSRELQRVGIDVLRNQWTAVRHREGGSMRLPPSVNDGQLTGSSEINASLCAPRCS